MFQPYLLVCLLQHKQNVLFSLDGKKLVLFYFGEVYINMASPKRPPLSSAYFLKPKEKILMSSYGHCLMWDRLRNPSLEMGISLFKQLPKNLTTNNGRKKGALTLWVFCHRHRKSLGTGRSMPPGPCSGSLISASQVATSKSSSFSHWVDPTVSCGFVGW